MDDSYFRVRHPLSEKKRVIQATLSKDHPLSGVIYAGTSSIEYKVTNGRGGRGGGPGLCKIESNSKADFTGTYGENDKNFGSSGTFTGSFSPDQPYVRFSRTVTYGKRSVVEMNRNSNRRITASYGGSATTDPLDVSFTNWSVTTGGTWWGTVEIERSTDNQDTWETFTVIADTKDLEAANFKYPSTTKEGGTTFVRVKFIHGGGVPDNTIKIVIKNESSYTEGIFQLDTYISDSSYKAIVINNASSSGATSLWTEGTFSARRGFPRASRFHQDRLWLAGSNFDTATVYGSISGDYYNFITGVESDLGIRRVIDTSEDIRWLLGKKFLFAGTSGSAIQITSADAKENVTASNIQTNPQSVFGASDIQGVLANDVIIYPQRNNLKLREMIYNWEEDNFKSNDITILNDEILSSGIKEMFLQHQADQIVWCIKENGDVSTLTYERQQEVVGWGRIVTDGDIISGCSLPTATGEDDIWVCTKRLGKFLIEKFRPRIDLDWYVDSAVKFEGGVCQTAESFTIGAAPDYKITVEKDDHNLADDDKIRMENVTGFDFLDDRVFTVADKTANTFVLKLEDGPDYMDGSTVNLATRSDPVINNDVDTYYDAEVVTGDFRLVKKIMTGLDHLEGKTVQVLVDGNYESDRVVTDGSITVGGYGNTILAGLQYESKLQPMPIEPVLANRLSSSRAKGVAKISIKFFKTKGAKIGQPDKIQTNHVALQTTDITDSPLSEATGEVRIFAANDWEREKIIEVRQNLPYPMTVLSMSIWTEMMRVTRARGG